MIPAQLSWNCMELEAWTKTHGAPCFLTGLLRASGTPPVWRQLSCYAEPIALCRFLGLTVMTFSRLSHFLSLHMPFYFSWPKSNLCELLRNSCIPKSNWFTRLGVLLLLRTSATSRGRHLKSKRNRKWWHFRHKHTLSGAIGCTSFFPCSVLSSACHPHSQVTLTLESCDFWVHMVDHLILWLLGLLTSSSSVTFFHIPHWSLTPQTT